MSLKKLTSRDFSFSLYYLHYIIYIMGSYIKRIHTIYRKYYDS